MFTEAEAKTKWCPYSRTVERHPGEELTRPRNRVVVTGPDGEIEHQWAAELAGTRCIGSACMAWRPRPRGYPWLVTLDGAPEAPWAWNPLKADPPQYVGRVTVRPNTEDAHGYCGAFGKPE